MKYHILSALHLAVASGAASHTPKLGCRTLPSDPTFPAPSAWASLNSTVGGRLVAVVPSAKFCESLPGGACTDAQWGSSVFRNEIPGAMNQVNWEQDYESHPPSLCLHNATTCDQGDVPLFAIAATTVSDVQAGVLFAQTHNLRLAIKASGHDYLGRSTAKSSLLIWTHHFQNITFADSFVVGNDDKGSVVTVGSGVTLQTLYQASKATGKIIVGGGSATVAASGGYVQGGGHSPLSPIFGLAADNAFEFQVVLANGRLVTANEIENPDLYWAMRGGGAGSWGVIISTTFQTFPTFNATFYEASISINSTEAVSDLTTLYAQHIFDTDAFRPGKYFAVVPNGTNFVMEIVSFFPNASIKQATVAQKAFVDGARAQGAVLLEKYLNGNINDILTMADDFVGLNLRMGSRLIPANVYRDSPEAFGPAFVELLKTGTQGVNCYSVAGGKVSENANISSAINPKWRTAKSHVLVLNIWDNSTSVSDALNIKNLFKTKQRPILEKLAGGAGSGSYSNEADISEPDFMMTFYGPNYARLSEIKSRYDPYDLFIVGAGVGSERWDEYGLCRV